jgi:hypothetical protein
MGSYPPFLLIGSRMTTGSWDPNLLFVNWISNANQLTSLFLNESPMETG